MASQPVNGCCDETRDVINWGPLFGCAVGGSISARRVRHTLLEPPAGLRACVAPLILFLKFRFCAGDRRFQAEYAARANGMRRRSFIVLLESPSKDEC